MARMLPQLVLAGRDGHAPSAAEQKVHAALREALDESYTAIGWVTWQSADDRGRPIEGEADFVVVHPHRGFLVLEVKGGGIGHDAERGIWWSADRQGRRNTIQDPFRQAAHNRREISKLLARRLGVARLPFMSQHAVAFPDVSGDPRRFGAEADADFVVLEDDLHSLGARIDRMFTRVSGAGLDAGTLPAHWARELEDLVAPSCSFSVRLGSVVREVTAAGDQLTAGQFTVLDALARNRRVLVTGSAGTGKTVLAVEKARRLARTGARTLLTCFNRPLADHLAAALAGEPNLVVHNFHQLCWRWARRNGFDGVDPDSPEVRDPAREATLDGKYFDVALPAAFVAALAATDERFDAVVVDEAQDFSPIMQRALLKSLRSPRRGFVFAFQDQGQGIFAGRTGWRCSGYVEFHLGRNLRNSRNIHGVARRLNPDDDATPTGPEGPEPEYIEVTDLASAARRIEERIRVLTTTDGIGLSRIAVLTAGRGEIATLAPDGRLGGFRTRQDPQGAAGALYLDRISRFKGLERDVVILTGLGRPPEHNRAEPLLYVAASRARSHLIVVDVPEVLARFRSG